MHPADTNENFLDPRLKFTFRSWCWPLYEGQHQKTQTPPFAHRSGRVAEPTLRTAGRNQWNRWHAQSPPRRQTQRVGARRMFQNRERQQPAPLPGLWQPHSPEATHRDGLLSACYTHWWACTKHRRFVFSVEGAGERRGVRPWGACDSELVAAG